MFGSAVVVTVSILAGLVQITGISLKDFFNGDRTKGLSSPKIGSIEDGIIIYSDTNGKLNFQGDILQNSTKIVIDKANDIDLQNEKSWENIDRLIRDIQSTLYGEEKQLPYALTLCLDLCQQVDLTSKYGLWLRKELIGYIDHEKFQKDFPDEESFDNWMRLWSEHRLVKTYIKIGYRSNETGQYKVDNLPFMHLLIGFPLADIIRKVEDGRNNQVEEYTIPVKTLGQGIFEKLNHDIAKYFPKVDVDVPDELLAFYKPEELNKIVNGVRNLVLSLLSESRGKIGG